MRQQLCNTQTVLTAPQWIFKSICVKLQSPIQSDTTTTQWVYSEAEPDSAVSPQLRWIFRSSCVKLQSPIQSDTNYSTVGLLRIRESDTIRMQQIYSESDTIRMQQVYSESDTIRMQQVYSESENQIQLECSSKSIQNQRIRYN